MVYTEVKVLGVFFEHTKCHGFLVRKGDKPLFGQDFHVLIVLIEEELDSIVLNLVLESLSLEDCVCTHLFFENRNGIFLPPVAVAKFVFDGANEREDVQRQR